MADIISEIQQYQNQPYCLHECPEVREFLENLDPFPEWADKEIDDYLWEKSCEIEPSAIDRSVDAPVRRRAVSKINKKIYFLTFLFFKIEIILLFFLHTGWGKKMERPRPDISRNKTSKYQKHSKTLPTTQNYGS